MALALDDKWFKTNRRLTHEQQRGYALYCAQIDIELGEVLRVVAQRCADDEGVIHDLPAYQAEVQKAAMAVLAPHGPS